MVPVRVVFRAPEPCKQLMSEEAPKICTYTHTYIYSYIDTCIHAHMHAHALLKLRIFNFTPKAAKRTCRGVRAVTKKTARQTTCEFLGGLFQPSKSLTYESIALAMVFSM